MDLLGEIMRAISAAPGILACGAALWCCIAAATPSAIGFTEQQKRDLVAFLETL
jgi:hypothetical protein